MADTVQKSTGKVKRRPIKEMRPKLHKCEPEYFKVWPKFVRTALAWFTIVLFSLLFLVVPISLIVLPMMWFKHPYTCYCIIAVQAISMLWPMKEWPIIRKWGQLWYELFDFSANIAPEEFEGIIERGDNEQFIIAMHPHGIIPFQAILWVAYCDQFLYSKKTGKSLYGFGAAADIVGHLPFLRNLMGWLTAGSASYGVLKAGLTKGVSAAANAAGRKVRHLYILPGGIAEIFVSRPGRNCIVFKDRRGLVKLSIETGAKLIPTYVFGGTDFFHNLATYQGPFAAISRRLRISLTLFWGWFGLPVPFTPKVTLCIGDAIDPPKWDGTGKVPSELIEHLHTELLAAMVELFESYKVEAGYPDAQLEIL